MLKTDKKRICIVASSLSKGGAQRSSANLSHMLASLGHDIFIVTVLPGVEYDYSGDLFNLGEVKKKNDSFLGRINRLRLFKNYLKTHNIDVIIDNRARVQGYREFLISKFIYKKPVIYVIHNFKTTKAFTKYTWLNTHLYKNQYMTAVSQAASDKFKKLFNLNKIRTLYNGFDFDKIQKQAQEHIPLDLPNQFIIFFGRIDDSHKNLKLLIDAYCTSSLAKHNVKLLILGEGEDLVMIKEYASSFNISEDIIFKGFIKNPYPYVKKAKFTVLTSRFEGFPMVIPESLCLGVPVVAVDCKSGPREIIKTGYNGILIENDNAQKLANAFETMMFDNEFYNSCLSNTVASVESFSVENIKQSWDILIKEVIE
nr:glycosyltransferase [uncultured Psychroserpens sp.]